MLRIGIGLFLSLIATQALADPCHAIPDKGPRPAWAKAGVVVTGTARYIIDGDGLCIGSSGDPERWVEIRLADYYAPELRESGGADPPDGGQDHHLHGRDRRWRTGRQL